MPDRPKVGPNKYIVSAEEKIGELAREKYEEGFERLKIRTTKLGSLLEVPNSTLRSRGFPHKLDEIYSEIRYEAYQGLIIDDLEAYIEEREQIMEEREEKRKEKRKDEIRENTENIAEVLEK